MTKMCKQAELGIVLIVCANAQALVMLQRCHRENSVTTSPPKNSDYQIGAFSSGVDCNVSTFFALIGC